MAKRLWIKGLFHETHTFPLAATGGHGFTALSAGAVGVALELNSRKTTPMDPGQWRSQGIEPANLSVIGVKAAVAHRRAYDSIASGQITASTAGPCLDEIAL